jgi:hypothetical protein
MPRSPTALASCTTLAIGLALGCGDAGGPVGPRQIVIAAGDSQSASLGATLLTPLKVRLVGTDNQPFPGAIVNWTVTQGGAVAQPPASVTDAAGEATTSLVLGLQTGPVRVTASVVGVAPVVFTATAAYDFPCQSITPLAFGVSGSLDPGDCNINGYYLDVLGLTLPSQRSLSIRMTSSAMDPWVGFYAGDGAFLAMNDDSLLTVVIGSMLNVIVPAGSYLITPAAFGPGDTGAYTLTLYDRSAVLTGCDADTAYLSFMDPALHHTGSDRSAVWLTRGVSFPESLTPGDCVDASGPFYSDRAFIWLDSGSALTVREASTDFDASLTLLGPNNFRAFNDDSADAATTTNAYLVVTAPVSAAYIIDFGTRDTAATGNYSISIAAGPSLTTSATRLGAPVRAFVAPQQPPLREAVVQPSP